MDKIICDFILSKSLQISYCWSKLNIDFHQSNSDASVPLLEMACYQLCYFSIFGFVKLHHRSILYIFKTLVQKGDLFDAIVVLRIYQLTNFIKLRPYEDEH